MVPKKLGKKPPYNHSHDHRLYRPEVPLSRTALTTLVPAQTNNRQLIDRGSELKDMHGNFLEHGVREKFKRYTEVREDGRDDKENKSLSEG